jgi:hypothetical protein
MFEVYHAKAQKRTSLAFLRDIDTYRVNPAILILGIIPTEFDIKWLCVGREVPSS